MCIYAQGVYSSVFPFEDNFECKDEELCLQIAKLRGLFDMIQVSKKLILLDSLKGEIKKFSECKKRIISYLDLKKKSGLNSEYSVVLEKVCNLRA